MNWFPARFGLLARVTFIYALGAMLSSSTVALATFALAQRNLVSAFEGAAQEQIFQNARTLQGRLDTLPNEAQLAEINESQSSDSGNGSAQDDGDDDKAGDTDDLSRLVLDDLFTPNGAQVLFIRSNGKEYSYSIQSRAIPSGLRARVLTSGSGDMRYATPSGEVAYGVGLDLPSHGVTYYEVSPMEDLSRTLSSLRVILIGVSLTASVAGALLGYYSARKALQPISKIAAAAEAIAKGNFEARLESTPDADLAGLTSSFNSMVDTLKARIERDERFASDVSHELRSPLMTLAASVEVLERRQHELPEPARQAVILLSQDIQRFQGLVEDLLEISRIDVGAVALDTSTLLLTQFLEAVVKQSRTPDVPIVFDSKFSDLIIVADKRRLAQALSNLLENARKYGGGPSAVGFRVIGKRVQITVEDSGPGVAPEDRTRIFDRFTRTKRDAGRRDDATGVGLGLSLVSEHIRLHGGQVWVTDRIDGRQGARFVIEIPVGDTEHMDEEMAI